MVAERDHVGAGGQQLVGDLRRDAESVGGVLTVDDAEVDVELLAQGWQALFDRAAAWPAVDVGYEEKLQGMARAAAGCSSIET